MLYKMVLSDLDGTLLLNADDIIKEEFITKIKKLTDCGTVFAVNSGRSYKVLRKLLKGIESRTIFICNDGAQIMYKNCLLYKNPISKTAVKTLSAELIKNGYEVFAVQRERNLHITEEIFAEKGNTYEETYKLIVIKDSEASETEKRLVVLAENLGLRVCFNDDRYIEFVDKTANKGEATKYIKTRFGIKNDVVAFGDGLGDFEMFKQADKVYIVKSKNKIFFDGAKQIDSAQDFIIENL